LVFDILDIEEASKSPFVINRDPSASPFRFDGKFLEINKIS